MAGLTLGPWLVFKCLTSGVGTAVVTPKAAASRPELYLSPFRKFSNIIALFFFFPLQEQVFYYKLSTVPLEKKGDFLLDKKWIGMIRKFQQTNSGLKMGVRLCHLSIAPVYFLFTIMVASAVSIVIKAVRG